METFFLLVIAVHAVFGTTTNLGQYSSELGGVGQVGSVGGDGSGEVYRQISATGSDDTGTSMTPSSGNEYADEKLISDILSEMDPSHGLPTDLISSLITNSHKNDDDDDDDMMAQIYRLTHMGDDQEDDSFTSDQHTAPVDTTTSTESTSGTKDIRSFVLGQLDVAKQIFENAKSQIKAADIANGAETNPASAVTANTKLAASSVILSAKSGARTSILEARKGYLSAVDQVKRDVTVLKALEKRFRAFAVAFAKARSLAGNALLALKRMAPESDDDDDDRRSYRRGYSSSSRKKENFLSAVAAAKSKIGTMKRVEKSFLLLTRALARGRALAYTNVRKARKSAVGLAQVMTMCDMSVKSSIDTAKSIISQAISTARATALAKAQVGSILAEKAEIQAQLAIQLAANALAAAKDFSETSQSSEDDDDSAEINVNDVSYPSSIATESTQAKTTDYQSTQSY